MTDSAIMATRDFETALQWQARHADESGAPCTARVVRALAAVRAGDTASGRRIANWQGLTLQDAVPLRMAGGLHYLFLSGADKSLARVYSGQITDQAQIDRIVCELVERFDTVLLPWLDGPPQTNEAGRSASVMAGLLWLAQRSAPRFDMFELGASAGVNTMMDRYHYRLGETVAGPAASPMHIAPQWRGHAGLPATDPPPPPPGFEISALRGCDVMPIDLSDADSALRLKSYVWPDAPARMARIDAAIALASANPPDLVKMDAAEFTAQSLAMPHIAGTTRVMFHTIMWQYMPAQTQAAITEAFEAAGAAARSQTPLAWISLETNRTTFQHELKIRLWNGSAGDGEEVLLCYAHPHGAWVEWLGAE